MDRSEAPSVLIAVAEAAQDVAAGLHKFLDPVADSDVDITNLIAKCFEVSASLRSLAGAVEETCRRGQPQGQRRYSQVSSVVDDVTKSLDHTFKDVHQLVGEGFVHARKAKVSMPAAYRLVWRNINEHFWKESGNPLVRRLGYCRLLLVDLSDILRDGSARDQASFEDLTDRVSKLLAAQMARLRQGIDWSDEDSLPTAGPSRKQPSFERERPTVARTSPPPQPKPKRPSFASRRRSSASTRQRRNPPPPPPFAPEVPRSDSSSRDSRSNMSSDLHEDRVVHWLPHVFDRPPPSTKLPETGQPSSCLGEDNPQAVEYLEEGYEKLIDIPFENGDMYVSLHLRLRDRQTRILCETFRPPRQRKDSTIYLTNLDIEREGQFLKLCHVNASQRRAVLWAVLRFTSYETLVLFFCTFLALRSQDNGRPMHMSNDWRLGREEKIFECEIQDDQFTHGLRLLRDKDSGGVRLQASVLDGKMEKMPVWTAFITHPIHSPFWMRQTGSKTILLADLYRYIFDDEYTPPIAPGGEHDLTFIYAEDVENFMDAIEELAERALEEEEDDVGGVAFGRR